MTDRHIKIPDEMLKAADRAIGKARREQEDRQNVLDWNHELWPNDIKQISIKAALLWLDEILHERNVDFHRAILTREWQRYPGEDRDAIATSHRVALEYGASFARNYVRDLFEDKDTDEIDLPTLTSLVDTVLFNNLGTTNPTLIQMRKDGKFDSLLGQDLKECAAALADELNDYLRRRKNK